MPISYKTIAPFISRQKSWSKWLSWSGLGIGVLLLLCALQMYFNIETLIRDRQPLQDGFDYISVTKLITNDNMGEDHSFTEAEIAELKKQTFIADATPLLANKFLVKATGSSLIPFTTDLFLESIDNSFIDTIPPDFSWKEGQDVLPVIMSADYLEMYNTVFAPSKDLPQFSRESISSVYVQIACYGNSGETLLFKGRVAGLSDRINSVLVPANFLEWANRRLSGPGKQQAQRVFLRTKDANSVELLNYLQSKQYQVNKDKTKFGRVKQVLAGVMTALSGFGLLVILLAMVLFSFYLQLMIANSRENLLLLLTLGYSPAWLSRKVASRWIPVYALIITAALLGALAFQYAFSHYAFKGREDLSANLHISVYGVAVLLLIICTLVNHRLIGKTLGKLK
jgi:hypothetical protein